MENKKAVTNAQVPAGPINYDDYRTVMPNSGFRDQCI